MYLTLHKYWYMYHDVQCTSGSCGMRITDDVRLPQMYTTRAGKDVLDAQRVHKCWPLLMSILLVILFLSRAIYNIIAVRMSTIHVFGDGSTFATDMVSYTQIYCSIISMPYCLSVHEHFMFSCVPNC